MYDVRLSVQVLPPRAPLNPLFFYIPTLYQYPIIRLLKSEHCDAFLTLYYLYHSKEHRYQSNSYGL